VKKPGKPSRTAADRTDTSEATLVNQLHQDISTPLRDLVVARPARYSICSRDNPGSVQPPSGQPKVVVGRKVQLAASERRLSNLSSC